MTKAGPNASCEFSDTAVRTDHQETTRKTTDEKILTKHPHPLGKSGKNIDRKKYDTLKKVIVPILQKTHTDCSAA